MRIRKLFAFLLVILCIDSVPAQKVGLVLSGGGAKGMVHIGVIKALEESEIPIDYVAGTSMGAIVSSFYAIGMSPDEMVTLLKSDAFHRWSMGLIEADEKYFYFNTDLRSSFISIPFRFDIKRLDSINIQAEIPTNIVSSKQMNLAFLELFAQETEAAGGNFDRLFVPFRCVASDVYTKKSVVHSSGNLGDAVRTSMTIPMVYKPIEIDSQLLFDGGLYNNFPVDVMKKDFHPNYIIGIDVNKEIEKPKLNDLVGQMTNILMSACHYDLAEKEGVIFRFDTKKYNILDFSKVDDLVKMGYDSTMVHIEEIKAQIKTRQTADKLAERRAEFKAKFPKFEFQNIYITNANENQQRYIKRFLQHENDVFTFDEFRKKYFMLLSDSRIKEIVPSARFNRENGNFDLLLDVNVQAPMVAHIGGNVSSSTSNEAYFGVSFQRLSNYAFTATTDAEFGKFYNFLGLSGRIDFPASTPFYIKMTGVFHRFSFFEKSKWFYEDNTTFDFNQNELFAKISAGVPVAMRGRLEGGIGYGMLMDHYRLKKRASASDARNDENRHNLATAYLRYENYTIDNISSPISGYLYDFSVQLISGNQHFTPANANDIDAATEHSHGTWLQIHAQYDNYFKLGKHFILGTYGEAEFSTRKFLNNYTATLIQSPTFAPTVHSKTVFNSAFRANKYAAAGIKPIIRFSDQLYLRNEFYWFVPFQKIGRTDDGKASYEQFSLTKTEYLAESSFVFYMQRFSVALFVNKYSHAVSTWNIGLNLGFLIFSDKFIY
ncbi:MAG: patatin-like phospholipase family protein [Prevotellaceae bacterium]|jgi:NTE family protein|nr:patatin-like phospholipase family protein [Prevotellaceae bacterium]